jgi:hypothetical protein
MPDSVLQVSHDILLAPEPAAIPRRVKNGLVTASFPGAQLEAAGRGPRLGLTRTRTMLAIW